MKFIRHFHIFHTVSIYSFSIKLFSLLCFTIVQNRFFFFFYDLIIWGLRRIHSIHWPHATEIYINHQGEDTLNCYYVIVKWFIICHFFLNYIPILITPMKMNGCLQEYASQLGKNRLLIAGPTCDATDAVAIPKALIFVGKASDTRATIK